MGKQTPDNLTPSMEDICDQDTITGASWGLCNAYCEAMDCELANDDDPATEPKASAVACDKVGGKYTQLMGEDPPCETAPSDCPCAAMEVYADAFGNAEKCFDYESMVMLTSSPNETIAVAAVPLLPDVPVCGSGLGFEEPVWEFLEISSDDANTCMADLRARAAELGLICETASPKTSRRFAMA